MRWVSVLAVAACGTDTGAILEVRAPDGPGDVARLELVLAADQPADTVDDQRTAPRDFTTVETVRYYRQRATAGTITGVGRADGFTVRIEPNAASEPHFIPFLVAYDTAAHVVGVGAVLDETGAPASIAIDGDGVRKYFADMVPLAPMDLARGMGPRESLVVSCEGTPRGIAWRPADLQLRLILGDAGALDLDCDGHAAGESDCDDLRPTFHAGRAEVCDGMDQNCDGARAIVQACANATCAEGGVQLCDDRTGQPAGACVQTAACACEGGPCAACAVAHKPTSNPAKQSPCAPAAGKLKLAACVETAPCTVDVVSATPPWTGYLSTSPTSGFTTRITVSTGEAYVELKAGDVTGQGGDSVGALHLAITQAGQTRLLPVDIQLASDTACTPIAGSGLFAMTCAP